MHMIDFQMARRDREFQEELMKAKIIFEMVMKDTYIIIVEI